MCVIPGRLASSAQFVVEPPEQVPEGLGTRDDVEWRRECATLVKITHPQFGAGKLPLDVGMVLEDAKAVFLIFNLNDESSSRQSAQLFYLDQFFTLLYIWFLLSGIFIIKQLHTKLNFIFNLFLRL